MARNNQPLIIGATVLGGVALLATLYTLFAGGGPPPTTPAANNAVAQTAPETKTVFVASRDIPPRTELTSDLFNSSEVPVAQVPPGAVTSIIELNGLLSKQPMKKGDVATVGPGSTTTRALQRVVDANIPIPQGFRGVAIYVNPDQTAAGLVDVGDRVDVIATHRFALAVAPNTRIEGSAQVSTGRVIGQNLVVLAVDKSLNAPPPVPTAAPEVPGAGAPPAGAGVPVAAVAPTPTPQPGSDNRIRVLLAAPVGVAARLVAAGEEGKLHILIRNPTGADVSPVPEVREYPSRLVAVPTPRQPGSNTAALTTVSSGGSSGGSGSSSRRRSSDDLSDLSPPARRLPDPTINTVPPATFPSGNISGGSGGNGGGGNGSGLPAPGTGAPVVPTTQENEVTVIRGTEKTRVLVPR